MHLTAQQQSYVLQLRPTAQAVAHKLSSADDEAEGIADLALCEAVLDYDPTRGSTLREHVRARVANAIKNWMTRETFARSIGTAGGAPSREQIDRQSSKGRHILNTGSDGAMKTSHELDTSLAAPSNRFTQLVPLLPKRLQPIAQARWLEHKTICDIASELGMSKSEVHRQCQEAEGFARLFLLGGLVTGGTTSDPYAGIPERTEAESQAYARYAATDPDPLPHDLWSAPASESHKRHVNDTNIEYPD